MWCPSPLMGCTKQLVPSQATRRPLRGTQGAPELHVPVRHRRGQRLSLRPLWCLTCRPDANMLLPARARLPCTSAEPASFLHTVSLSFEPVLWLQVVFVTGEAAQAPEIFSSAFSQYGMSSSFLVLASCAGMGILLNYSIFLATLVCGGFLADLTVLLLLPLQNLRHPLLPAAQQRAHHYHCGGSQGEHSRLLQWQPAAEQEGNHQCVMRICPANSQGCLQSPLSQPNTPCSCPSAATCQSAALTGCVWCAHLHNDMH